MSQTTHSSGDISTENVFRGAQKGLRSTDSDMGSNLDKKISKSLPTLSEVAESNKKSTNPHRLYASADNLIGGS